MVKRKHTRKGAKTGKATVAEVETASPQIQAGSSRPPEQRYYDMPYSSPSPRLINPELGLHNLMARAGHNAAYEIDVTLLDAPDHRLIRSGVLLAHRVLDGRGEWYLSASDWQPLLPEDRIEPMGDAELPEDLANLIRPLRRRATLGPVAALRCERREFALRDDRGTTMALLRDDKVTVRRGGLTTARYRQVLLTPVGPGLDEAQLSWLDRALTQFGANRVPRFPRLVTRLGAPATGPTDIPEVTPFEASAPFKKFVSQLLALRLRLIVEADLAIRGGNEAAAGELADQAAQLRLELKGLSFVLDPDWLEDLYDELDWIILEPEAADSGPEAQRHLIARMSSERYLTLLERLVSAVRSPKLASGPNIPTTSIPTASIPTTGTIAPGGQPAADVLASLVAAAVAKLRSGADALTVDSPDPAWLEASRAIRQLQWVGDLTGHILEAETSRLDAALARPQRLLAQIHQAQLRAEQAVSNALALTAAEAFEAGRDFEREAAASRRVRREFVAAWAKSKKKLVG